MEMCFSCIIVVTDLFISTMETVILLYQTELWTGLILAIKRNYDSCLLGGRTGFLFLFTFVIPVTDPPPAGQGVTQFLMQKSDCLNDQ